MGEIRFENMFIDGKKIEVNSNCYTFVWKSSVNKNEIKMFEKIKELVSEINLTEIKDFTVSAGTLIEDLTLILNCLNEKTMSITPSFTEGNRLNIDKKSTVLLKYVKNQKNCISSSVIGSLVPRRA